jgi:hypothetical protein
MRLLLTLVILSSAAAQLLAAEITNNGADIPAVEGYEKVRLPGMDGVILKPKGWFFSHHGTSNSYIYKITKENPTNDFLTGFTITVAPNVSKVTRTAPSEYAKTVLTNYPNLQVISKSDGCSYSSGQGTVQQQEWVVDQKVQVHGTNLVCRVGVSTMAIDNIDLLVVIVFGTPREEWDANRPIYDTVCQKVCILGPHPGE